MNIFQLPARVMRSEIERIRNLAGAIGSFQETAYRAREIKELADELLDRTTRTYNWVVESWVCTRCKGRGHLVMGIIRNIEKSDSSKCGCWCGCKVDITQPSRFVAGI